LTGRVQKFQGYKKQGKIEELSQIGGDKATESNVESWNEFWNYKRM
jgi:hypothetical protein